MTQALASDADGITKYLVSLVADEDPDGETVPEIIQRISDQLEDRHDFVTRLSRAGYRPSDAELYRQRLVLVDSLIVPMTVVPRVQSADSGVSKIRFEVERRLLEPHKLDAKREASLFGALGAEIRVLYNA